MGRNQQPSPRHRGVRDWCALSESAFRLRGRVDSDAVWASQSPANTATFGELPDVVGLTAPRIGAERGAWGGLAVYRRDRLAGGQVVIRDLFMGWGTLPGIGEFRLGHLREPFSLEGGTSANTFAFLERSPVNGLIPHAIGAWATFAAAQRKIRRFALGIFQSGTDSSDLQGGDGSDTAVTGRWTGAVTL